MVVEIMGVVAYISLTVLSLYGLFVFRRFDKHMEEIRKEAEEERCG